MTFPTIEVNPQSWEMLKARYQAALTPAYDVSLVLEGKLVAPSTLQKHVFDTEDGMRLVISTDITAGKHLLHFSASVWDESKVSNLRRTQKWVLKNLHRLSGTKYVLSDMTEVAVSLAGVIHMFKAVDQAKN